jgi:hypothetical protein
VRDSTALRTRDALAGQRWDDDETEDYIAGVSGAALQLRIRAGQIKRDAQATTHTGGDET